RASERAEALVVEALRAGVKPKWAKDRPFTAAAVTGIQQRYGIFTRGPRAIQVPDIDAATLDRYIEQLNEVTVERRDADLERTRVSEEAERLIVDALRAGVQRKHLLKRPFSGR